MRSTELSGFAKNIVEKLKKAIPSGVFHIYTSYSSNSIYLKVDYGVGGSIRISDHAGKANLAYRFNIRTDLEGTSVKRTAHNNGTEQFFYDAGASETLIADVSAFRLTRVVKYKNYDSVVKRVADESKDTKGFWQGAIKLGATYKW